MAEIIPIVNENDEVIGSVDKDKFDKTTGDIYRTVSLFLFNQRGEILIQKRSFSKKTFPGKWDVAAVAGHVDFGESYLEAISRETEEEIGLKIANFHESEKTFTKTADGKRRFTQIFWAIENFEIDDLKIPEDEVSEVRLIKISELGRMFEKNSQDFAHYNDSALENLAAAISKFKNS